MAEHETNIGWEKIFSHFNIRDKLKAAGIFHLKATDIKKISNREPRLMCKFDNRDCRPKIIKDSDITILPIKNGEYVLIHGDGYYNLPPIYSSIEFLEWPFSTKLETLPKKPRSESQVIDLAFATGLLTHFLQDDHLALTIRGRLRSDEFKFNFKGINKTHELIANGVQIEIDSGFEGDRIYLIEAKMGEWDDFHIRQLYYPLRMWMQKNVSKQIIPIFISYANEIFSISQYEFRNVSDYSSIAIMKSTNYTFETKPQCLTFDDVLNNATPKFDISGIPFPQADDIRKVRDTIDLVSRNFNTKDKIAEFWRIDKRQGDYYANAALYLGFITKGNKCWVLTEKGKKFIYSPTTIRNKILAESVFEHPAFLHAALEFNDSKAFKNTEKILEQNSNISLSKSTIHRRAKTINSWIRYLYTTFESIKK